MRLAELRQSTITSIKGPLLFLENVISAKVGEVVKIIASDAGR